MALWSGPTASPSSRSPWFCTWSLRGLALGPTLNAPFGASKWLPGPFWPGWSGAGPTTILQRGPTTTLQRGPTTIRAVSTFLMDVILTVWATGVKRGQAASWDGPLAPLGLWSPALCACALRFAKRKAKPKAGHRGVQVQDPGDRGLGGTTGM